MRLDAAADQMSGDEWIRSHPDVQVGLGPAVCVSSARQQLSVASICQLALNFLLEPLGPVLLHVNKPLHYMA